jgi:hypothetical protein
MTGRDSLAGNKSGRMLSKNRKKESKTLAKKKKQDANDEAVDDDKLM